MENSLEIRESFFVGSENIMRKLTTVITTTGNHKIYVAQQPQLRHELMKVDS